MLVLLPYDNLYLVFVLLVLTILLDNEIDWGAFAYIGETFQDSFFGAVYRPKQTPIPYHDPTKFHQPIQA